MSEGVKRVVKIVLKVLAYVAIAFVILLICAIIRSSGETVYFKPVDLVMIVFGPALILFGTPHVIKTVKSGQPIIGVISTRSSDEIKKELEAQIATNQSLNSELSDAKQEIDQYQKQIRKLTSTQAEALDRLNEIQLISAKKFAETPPDLIALQEKYSELEKANKYLEEQVQSLRREKNGLLGTLTVPLDDQHYEAIARAEHRSWNFMKRLDEKEQKIFDEIHNDVITFEKYKNTLPKDGFEFEEYVANILRGCGYEDVEVTKKSHDWGTDIIATKNDIKYLIQCKYYNGPVGSEAIREVYTSLTHYRAHVGVVATNSVFTHAAKITAEETRCLLFDGQTLEKMKANWTCPQ